MPHPLAAVLERAASGAFPPADGATDVLAPDADGTLAVVCFTGHAFVLADVDSDDVARLQSDDAGGGLGGALAPELLLWLAGPTDHVGTIDVVMAARGTGGGAPCLARRDDQLDHPRARRAADHRRDVEIRGDDDGIVIVGRGLVGRRELSVELFAPGASASGAGRRLIRSGLGLVPEDEWCWAQVAPGNARSLRAFLASGFLPVSSEVLINPPAASNDHGGGLGSPS